MVDNAHDVALHVTWFAFAAGLVAADAPRARRWTRRAPVDRCSVIGLWDAARELTPVRQKGARAAVRFPALPSPTPAP